MGPLNEPCLLALDGGNSKTDVLLVAEDGTVITRARAGAFVPHIVGAPAAVASLADAVAEVRNAAHYITKANGGQGAIREVTDMLIAECRG